MSKLKIGFSEIDITPDKRASLIGQFVERVSQYVEKPITATAMAIEAAEEQVVIVSADLGGVSYNLIDATREELKNNKEGLDPMKVVYVATHVHTGPTYPRYNSTV